MKSLPFPSDKSRQLTAAQRFSTTIHPANRLQYDPTPRIISIAGTPGDGHQHG
ncbi:hypothetical protein HMPREF9141_0860 [Prevotella multiformis DSM 16608]|uniref:Uncharacterized protein n=1 Tax=Prevotella multiformis DSM 16608 TaxID=888743 RepID=F0F5J4_9BACT|nr:hypothetical protein HMPREF9141_0860 [Prevotella multiformis DSM 16608]